MANAKRSKVQYTSFGEKHITLVDLSTESCVLKPLNSTIILANQKDAFVRIFEKHQSK